MNKSLIILIALLSVVLSSSLVLAETSTIKDTSIEYTPYREVVVNEPGVVYLIKIINTGTKEKDYEIIPDSAIIKSIGTYRMDPSDKITLGPNQQETLYIYLSVEKALSSRTIIPVTIKVGSAETNIDLVVRAVGPFTPEQPKTSLITAIFKIILSAVLAIIIIIAIILGFRKIRKKKEEETEEGLKQEFEEEVETYY